MTQEQDTKRDRLNAYVEPETTKLIAKIQQELKDMYGVRFTIGQAVDYLATQFIKNDKNK